MTHRVGCPSRDPTLPPSPPGSCELTATPLKDPPTDPPMSSFEIKPQLRQHVPESLPGWWLQAPNPAGANVIFPLRS